ncbi:MAG: hypothetical protein HC799_09620 [Limnothrix sp. RL_2_0]|nr:hypothetical protein [Limnothrix sp. RL_2_0]
MDNIIQLAQQGSIKAIMQILNKQLRDAGVNTKIASGDHGVLEILCEAGHPENLDKHRIVDCIQRSLDQIAPRTFQKVHIQSRLTNDTQALWVSTLSQGERRKLIWSEDILINHISWVQKLLKDLGIKSPAQPPVKKRQRGNQKNAVDHWFKGDRQGWVIIGAIAAVSIGWAARDWALLKTQVQLQSTTNPTQNAPRNSDNTSDFDAFNQSVRLATQAANGGKTATTYGEWLDLANRWQQASDLMKRIPQDHPRYTEAQERVLSYRQNSEVALAKAKMLTPNP